MKSYHREHKNTQKVYSIKVSKSNQKSLNRKRETKKGKLKTAASAEFGSYIIQSFELEIGSKLYHKAGKVFH